MVQLQSWSELRIFSNKSYLPYSGLLLSVYQRPGKNKNPENYGEIAQNAPHYPGRNFTSVKPFNFEIAENTKNCRNLVNFYLFWKRFSQQQLRCDVIIV